MKPSLTLCLGALPLLLACAEGGPRPQALHAADPAQPGTEAEWVRSVLSAKAAGSLYRTDSFFLHAPAAADAAAALP